MVAVEAADVEGGGRFVGDDGGGGFMEEEGGFAADDDGGGFLPNGPGQGDGDFGTDDTDTPARADEVELEIAGSKRIPLSVLPSLLASLGLPNDDDVLSVFRSSASGWDVEDGDSHRRKRDDEVELGVEKKDFRAVCAALMGPDESAAGASGGSGNEDEEDVYRMPSDGSSLSSVSDSEYDAGPGAGPSRVKGRRSGSPKARTSTRRSRKVLEVNDRAKLSSRQKEVVQDIWDMLKPKAKDGGRGSHILGRDDLKHWVRTLGEMWTEDEVNASYGFQR